MKIKRHRRLVSRASTNAARAGKSSTGHRSGRTTKSTTTNSKVFDLVEPWSIDVTLLAPDPTGYQAIILDEIGIPVARSIREQIPMDFENKRFNFIFVPHPRVTLDYTKHQYRLVVAGPSGLYVPFEGMTSHRVDTAGIRVNCSTCHGSNIGHCPVCSPHTRDDDDIPF